MAFPLVVDFVQDMAEAVEPPPDHPISKFSRYVAGVTNEDDQAGVVRAVSDVIDANEEYMLTGKPDTLGARAVVSVRDVKLDLKDVLEHNPDIRTATHMHMLNIARKIPELGEEKVKGYTALLTTLSAETETTAAAASSVAQSPSDMLGGVDIVSSLLGQNPSVFMSLFNEVGSMMDQALDGTELNESSNVPEVLGTVVQKMMSGGMLNRVSDILQQNHQPPRDA